MLALIAGRGGLPLAIAEALTARGCAFKVYALAGFAPDLPDVTEFRVEALGRVLRDLRSAGVTELCFAGAMQRPAVEMSKLHPLSLPLVPRLMKVIGAGDDRLLREVIAIFEEAGLTVVGAHDLVPELLAAAGPIGAHTPSDALLADAARGAEILKTTGALDIGQGCVVSQGLCLALETLPGTDAMLRFVQEARAGGLPAGGVLVKRAKPGQDLRVDMPTIGPDTIAAAHAAGLSGLALEAGRILIIDKERTIAAADAADLALWGMAS